MRTPFSLIFYSAQYQSTHFQTWNCRWTNPHLTKEREPDHYVTRTQSAAVGLYHSKIVLVVNSFKFKTIDQSSGNCMVWKALGHSAVDHEPNVASFKKEVAIPRRFKQTHYLIEIFTMSACCRLLNDAVCWPHSLLVCPAGHLSIQAQAEGLDGEASQPSLNAVYYPCWLAGWAGQVCFHQLFPGYAGCFWHLFAIL